MATTSAAGNVSAGFPMCILTPCTNSHPFEERRILVTRSEESAVKIGRSVVRLQPASNNAIFDCKVLSRNHAILWVNVAGQFLIKDTRSSNGTFINNERLSISGEESEPRELFSGDILQLGVEIVDTAKKVASGCVTCIVRLFNERGEECAGRPKLEHTLFQEIPHNYTLVKNDKLFILDQYIKEAKHRENQLGLKLQTLEDQLRVAHDALQVKWQEQVDQELLLSRIEHLESQLDNKKTKLVYTTTTTRTTTCATTATSNGGVSSSKNGVGNECSNSSTSASMTDQQQHQQRLATELRELAEDRGRIEQAAKESLRAMQEQMQETVMKMHDAEMSLINVEEECIFLRQRCTDFEAQMVRQRDEFDALLAKYNSLLVQKQQQQQQQKGEQQHQEKVLLLNSAENNEEIGKGVVVMHEQVGEGEDRVRKEEEVETNRDNDGMKQEEEETSIEENVVGTHRGVAAPPVAVVVEQKEEEEEEFTQKQHQQEDGQQQNAQQLQQPQDKFLDTTEHSENDDVDHNSAQHSKQQLCGNDEEEAASNMGKEEEEEVQRTTTTATDGAERSAEEENVAADHVATVAEQQRLPPISVLEESSSNSNSTINSNNNTRVAQQHQQPHHQQQLPAAAVQHRSVSANAGSELGAAYVSPVDIELCVGICCCIILQWICFLWYDDM